MSKLTTLSPEEEESIRNSFPLRTYKKGSYLLRTGHVSTKSYYVVKGCIREYKLIDGEEKTTAFYTENQSVINFHSLVNKVPSEINFVCTEDTEVTILDTKLEEDLYQKHPRFERFCRSGMEQMMGEKQNQLSRFIVLKPEERYLWLMEERADLLNRVPQHQIASYLGIKPETLSRIRARLADKGKTKS